MRGAIGIAIGTGLALAVALVGGGCGYSTGRWVVVARDPYAGGPEIALADRAGEYTLARLATPPRDDGAFLHRVTLRAGDALGFERDGTGGVIAVAGGRRVAPLPDGAYVWQRAGSDAGDGVGHAVGHLALLSVAVPASVLTLVMRMVGLPVVDG